MSTRKICNFLRPFLNDALFNPMYYKVISRSEYRSAISLQNLHPQSSLKITTPVLSSITEKAEGIFSGYIPLDKLQLTFSRSPGPGGQHANTTNSKVHAKFHIASADWLHDTLKEKLLNEKSHYITKEGYFHISSDKTRCQQLNIADVLRRIRIILHKLAVPDSEPTPETLEMIRKRKEKANRERLMSKRWHSLIKRNKQVTDD